MGAGAGELVERIGEESLLAAEIVDEKPDNEASDSVDEADGGSFDVFVDVDGAGVQVDVLVEPEEIEEVRNEDDSEGGKEGVAESGLEDGDGHDDVILTVVTIGGGGGEGEKGTDEDGNGSYAL